MQDKYQEWTEKVARKAWEDKEAISTLNGILFAP
jgi:hypothetical protein